MAYIHIEPTERTYAKAYRVFKGNPSGNQINIKTTYPKVDYTKLTNNDFIGGYIQDGSQHQDWFQTGNTRQKWSEALQGLQVTYSYNPSTGILTVNKSTNSATSSNFKAFNWSGLVCEVIMIVDGVRSEYT